MKKYKIFGLNILSEIDLGYSEDVFIYEDVIVKRGHAINKFQTTYYNRNGFYVNSKQAFFRVDESLAISIHDGNKIIVEYELLNLKKINLFLLGSAMGILLLQRNLFSLHGSSVCDYQKGICVIGDSGAGKTSLARGFINKGYNLLSDDVSRVDTHEFVNIISSYPSQKMWKDTLNYYKLEGNKENQLLERYDKYYLDVKDKFKAGKNSLDVLLYLRAEDIQEPYIRLLEVDQAFSIIHKNTYRYELIDTMELKQNHFKWISEVLSTTPVYELVRPIDGITIDSQIEHIENLFSRS